MEIVLHPFTQTKRIDGVETDITTEDWVACDLGNGLRSWGRVDRVGGVFVPLSGFPKELVPEVQEAINRLRGCEPGTGPEPLEIVDSGPTNIEQEAEGDSDDDEEYE